MAKKKLDLQSILDNPEQLASLQKEAMYKRRGISLSKTFAANPDVKARMAKSTKATFAADPNILKKSHAKRLATLAANPDIMKRLGKKVKATLAANPDILKRRILKYQATLAKKRELHTPYGVFTTKASAANALIGRYEFTQLQIASVGGKITNLIKTNPKEWYWVKKT